MITSALAKLFKKERRSSLTALLLLLTVAAWAQQVGQADALQRAKDFMANRGRAQVVMNGTVSVQKGQGKKSSRQFRQFYVFNVSESDGGGFVVVSGDERTEPILGYADSGSLDEDNIPDALRYMLEGYATQMEWLDSNPQTDVLASRQNRKMTARSPIAPIIATRWNQGSPYNNLCPEMTYKNDNNEEVLGRAVTGCVATSMAQVMYYYKWPKTACSPLPGYTGNGITLPDLPAVTFAWSDMTPTYNSTSSDAAKTAVATLMQYCGTALRMSYGVKGSSAYNVSITETLKKYFGYDGGMRSVFRSHYSYQDWIGLVYSELACNRPVILGGRSTGGGHSFVCDGYEAGDYFHINWGWGGTSDGYFRLSALNPYEQGIGGSSTLDGFSFSQEALVGIQPPVDGNADYCLMVYGLSFGANNYDTEKTFTRTLDTDAFTGIDLYLTLYSYVFDTNTYDYAIQLVDGNGVVKHVLYENTEGQEIIFNKSCPCSPSDLSIPSTIADGTYYIKVVSRPHGDGNWMECYDGDRFELTATISNNTLTINTQRVFGTNPSLHEITIVGEPKVGYETEVIATVTGGSSDFNESLFLYVDDKRVQGKQVDISRGQTVDVHFYYTPSTSGSKTLKIYANSTLLGSKDVNINESDATNNLALTFSGTLNNLTTDGKLYANAMRATITATNSSTEKSYAGKLNCSIRKWTSDTDWESVTVITKPLVVPKRIGNVNGQTATEFSYDGLESGALYSFRFTYTKNDEVTDALHLGLDANDAGSLATAPGYAIGGASGTTTIYPVTTNTIDAGGACFVDLTAVSDISAFTFSNTNNNCLYLLPSGATVPDDLSGKNVVCGDAATSITIDDASDFFSPINFTAGNISYTRTFTTPAGGKSGWTTLMLPFNVSSVTCEDLGDVDWFRNSSDTGKNFWLRSFTGDASGKVYFDFAQSITANTPYLIAVPGDTWGDSYRMTGRAVTFSATNADITATNYSNPFVSGNNYEFCGSTASTSVKDVYLLNAAGSKFAKQTSSTSVDAFRAWINPISISSLSMASLSISAPETNGIITMQIGTGSPSANGWYTMSGTRLDSRPVAKGLYIYQGKKIIIR